MRLKPFKKEKEISKETIKKNAPLLLVPLVIGIIGITYLVSSFAFYNYEVDDVVLANATVGDFAPSSAMIARKNSGDKSSFWKYADSITSVEFLSDTNKQEIIVPENAIDSFDVSVEQNETIKAWVVDDGSGASTYKLYFQGKNKIILNEDSSYLFYEFKKTTSITGLENVDTSNLTNMTGMFFKCRSLTSLDVSNFDTSQVTSMYQLFSDCGSLTELDVTNFDTSNVTTMWFMFGGCYGLTSIDVSKFDTSKVTNMRSMFGDCKGLTSIDVSNFDTSQVTDFLAMFANCSNLTNLDLSSFDTSSAVSMYRMFDSCSNLESIDMSSFDTSSVTNMSQMFLECRSLTNLDLTSFDTSNVTDMSRMFSECRSLTNLDLTPLDTSKVTDMSRMFSGCSGLTNLDLTPLDTLNVTNMSSMFSGCSGLTNLDLTSLDTSNVTNILSMFYGCSGLTNLDLTSLDTLNVTNMSSMFAGCSGLTNLDLTSFDTSNVTNMSAMFTNCNNLTSLDLSDFDTSNVTDMSEMFYNCTNLANLNINNFDFTNVGKISYYSTSYKYAHGFLESCPKVITIINIKNNSITQYQNSFLNAATASGAQITVNYTEESSDLVDLMIATKSSNSNVVKGSLIPSYNVTINSDNVTSDISRAYVGRRVTLSPTLENKGVKSFRLNGTLINGNTFTMPDSEAVITDVEFVDMVIVESEHNPYPNSLNNKVYYENTFEGAKSLTVTLEYQTESTSYDWIYLYDSSSATTAVGNKKYGGGTTIQTETITIDSNYLKIVFRTDGSGNNYYGFKATIVPNY